MSTSSLLVAFLATLVSATILALALWVVRRFFPRSEDYLFGPISNVGYLMGKLAGRAVRLTTRLASRVHQDSGRQAP